MERLEVKYQPIISIQIEDEVFGASRLNIIPQSATKLKIEKHTSLEKKDLNLYSLAFITKETAEHKSLEDIIEPDFSLREQVEHHSLVTYDYQKQNQEYTRQVLLPLADASIATEDLDNHIFESNSLLKFSLQINPLLKDSLLPEDNNEPKLIFTDDILTPSSSVREKSISITPILENGNLKWRIEEEGKALKEVTALNLEDNLLIECHVNIPSHLANVHSINYYIHIKKEIINNP
jgi:hypothetical protein